MVRRSITYKNFKDEEVTRWFQFNISKTELVDLDKSYGGQFKEVIEAAVDAKDGMKLYDIIKDLIVRSNGEATEDGERFIKTKEVQDKLTETDALSEFIFGMLDGDAKSLLAFIEELLQVPSTNPTKVPVVNESTIETIKPTPIPAQMDMQSEFERFIAARDAGLIPSK